MALRPQTSPIIGDLIAIGVMRADSTGQPVGPDGQMTYAAGKQQLASPLTGTTLQLTDDGSNGLAYITPAGTIATLLVSFPAEANSKIGQERIIVSSQIITTLNLAQLGGGGVFLQPPTTLPAGGSATFLKVAANTWARMQ